MSGLMEWEGGSSEQGWRKGPWTPAEDKLLSDYINLHGDGRWTSVAKYAGLKRSGKSCRLRWVNYLKPGLKKENLTPQEEGIIIELHALWGNKWSTIARYLPGRTDNEIKNYWRTHFKIKPKTSQRQATRRAETLALKSQQHRKTEAIYHVDNKYITAQNGNYDEVMNNEKVTSALITQGNQQMVFAHPAITNHDHHQSSSPMTDYNIDNYTNIATYSDTLTLDDLWGFWNLNDRSGGQGYLYTNTPSVKNHTSTYSCVAADRVMEYM